MFFLAFQEYLKWYGKKDVETMSICMYQHYLQSYKLFCQTHHVYDNLQDVYVESNIKIFSEK